MIIWKTFWFSPQWFSSSPYLHSLIPLQGIAIIVRLIPSSRFSTHLIVASSGYLSLQMSNCSSSPCLQWKMPSHILSVRNTVLAWWWNPCYVRKRSITICYTCLGLITEKIIISSGLTLLQGAWTWTEIKIIICNIMVRICLAAFNRFITLNWIGLPLPAICASICWTPEAVVMANLTNPPWTKNWNHSLNWRPSCKS